MKILTIFLAILLSTSLASALILNSVDSDILAPGQEGQIRIEVENNLNDDADDVSLSLEFKDLPFIPIGSSEQTAEEIDEDDDEEYVFRVRAAHDVTPGDFEIPYTLRYEINGDEKIREGTIGIRVKANPILSFTISTTNAIINQQGQLSLKVVNKGFSDARFVSVRVLQEGYTVLSDNEEYIGEVESDDFETATFDVLFNSRDAEFSAVIEYIDFDNKKIIEAISLPITVYTTEEAIALGLITPSKVGQIVPILITLILIWILWRTMKRSRRAKRSLAERK